MTHRLPHPTPPSLYLTSKKQEQNHLENHSNIITHFSINGTKSLQKSTKKGQKQSKKSCALLLYQHIIKGLTVNFKQCSGKVKGNFQLFSKLPNLLQLKIANLLVKHNCRSLSILSSNSYDTDTYRYMHKQIDGFLH